MNASKMRNMIVIKDLPSNIVEEAYVILKQNVKLKERDEEKTGVNESTPDFIIKEAENVVSNYLSNLENNKKLRNLEVEKIKKKYEKLRKFCIGLGTILVLNLFVQIIG